MGHVTTPQPIRATRIEEPLFERAIDRAQHTAIIDGERTLTYAQLARAACAVARDLRTVGVQPGDRVAIFLEKSAEAVVALYGAWIADAIAVPIHDALHAPQVRHILSHSGARVLVTSARLTTVIDAALSVSARDTTSDTTRVALAIPRVTVDIAAHGTRDVRGACTTAAILYTSGSTGRPKGIALSHDNLLAGARIVSEYLNPQPDERVLSVLPFTFDYGLNQLLTTVRSGATLVLQRSLLPTDLCASLQRHAITVLAGVPPLWIQLMQRASPFPTMTFPALRTITNSGGAFPVELVARYRARLPHTRLFLMYGLTEAFRSTYLPPSELDRRPGSIGKAIPECTIHVVTEDGRAANVGEIGELVHTGPTVAMGYWGDPSATAARFRPHPFDPRSSERAVYSGDLVKRDDDGFLYFVGRRDQQIKSHGFRISPEEVEEIVHESGLVSEVIARGAPDEVGGQAVELFVVPRAPHAFDTAALLAFCRAQMPRYMVPKQVVVRGSLPRTSSGKVDRARVSE